MKRKYLAAPYIIWILGFTILPLITIAISSFTDDNGSFTWKNFLAIADPINRQALLFSLAIALGCTFCCLLLAYPAAMALKSLHFKQKGFLMFLLVLPMWMNFILRILAWQMILSRNGILNFLLGKLGISPLSISNTWISLMIGMVYDFLPYMILPIFNAISDIDTDTIEAAKDLGAGSLAVFWKIIFPLSMPGMLSGIVMVFVPSMTSFVIADILGGGKLQLIGNIIEQEFMKSMDWHLGAGLSISLMLLVLVSLAFTMKNDRKEKRTILW
jgi:spermidine/putrescine transport system permease protein